MPTPWVLSLPLLIMAVHRAVVFACARRGPEAEDLAGVDFPVTWFRPLKGGVRDLPQKVDRFLATIGAQDEVIFGVDPGSRELEVCAELARRDARVQVVQCGPTGMTNPKIAKLYQMAPLARHDAWVVMDAEAMPSAEFIRTFRSELAANDVVTAGYRMVGMQTPVEWLDVIPVIQTLWPGLKLVCAFGRLTFTLGACTGVRRAQIQQIGGWEALGNCLAEDHRLGHLLSRAGHSIVLSRAVLPLEADALSLREYWRHQRRVAITYRVAAPLGAAGMIATRGFALSLALACVVPSGFAFGLVLAAAVIHVLSLAWEGKRLGYRLGGWVVGGLVSDVVESLCWALSWGARGVWWGGKWRRVTRGGELFAS